MCYFVFYSFLVLHERPLAAEMTYCAFKASREHLSSHQIVSVLRDTPGLFGESCNVELVLGLHN